MAGLVVTHTLYPHSVFSPIFAAAASDFPFWAPLTQLPEASNASPSEHLWLLTWLLGCCTVPSLSPTQAALWFLGHSCPCLPCFHQRACCWLLGGQFLTALCLGPGDLGHEAGRHACACPCQTLRMGGPLESLALDLGCGGSHSPRGRGGLTNSAPAPGCFFCTSFTGCRWAVSSCCRTNLRSSPCRDGLAPARMWDTWQYTLESRHNRGRKSVTLKMSLCV